MTTILSFYTNHLVGSYEVGMNPLNDRMLHKITNTYLYCIFQCCGFGSGSGRIRIILPDPDPEKKFGSGSGSDPFKLNL